MASVENLPFPFWIQILQTEYLSWVWSNVFQNMKTTLICITLVLCSMVKKTHNLLFHFTANVRSLVTRGKLTRDKADKALSMLKGALDYSDFKDVDMVIEVSRACRPLWLWNLEILVIFWNLPLEWGDCLLWIWSVHTWDCLFTNWFSSLYYCSMTLGWISIFTVSLKAIWNSFFDLQAVIESVPLKQKIFSEIEKICPPHCILATNTSTIDLNLVGEKTSSQDRIIGAHFFRLYSFWFSHSLSLC